MDIFVELSGEHDTLPHAELASALVAEHLVLEAEKRAQRLVVGKVSRRDDADLSRPDLLGLLDRLAMAHRAASTWATTPIDLDAAVSVAERHPLPKRVRFAVSADRIEDHTRGTDPEKRLRSKQIETALGGVWSKTNPVDLEEPSMTVRAVMHHDQLHIGEQLWENDRSEFEWRAPKRRPHFSPVSGHPRLMRAIVNLAQVPRGGTLYDPVCGTGGILIEAGLMEHRVIGSDIDPEMVQGTLTNLAHLGVEPVGVFESDVRTCVDRLAALVEGGALDGVVADLPYGQSASTRGADPAEVARWTMEAAVELLPSGKRAVLGLGDASLLEDVPAGLRLVERHEVKAHRTRTRTYVAFERA